MIKDDREMMTRNDRLRDRIIISSLSEVRSIFSREGRGLT